MCVYISLLTYCTQVLQLLTEHDSSDEEVARVKEKVDVLMESYRLVEASGHREVNQIRDIASSLEWNWTRFQSDMEHRQKNLHLSLNFHENLFEVLYIRVFITCSLSQCLFMYICV